MEKFAGVGLFNIVLIWLVCCILTLMLKTVILKFEAVPDSVQSVITAI